MIKDGNYHFYDFEKDKDKFKEVLTRYYGEQHRDKISQKIDRMGYVPYITEDFIYYYGFCMLNKYREEIAHTFASMIGLKDIPAEISDKDGMFSELCSTGLLFGDNIDKAPVSSALIEEVHNARQEVARILQLENDNQYDEENAMYYMAMYINAENAVMKNHSGHNVFDDIIKYTENKQNQLQAYLYFLNRQGFVLDGKDKKIFNSPDFQEVDAEWLKSKLIYFGADITEGGLLEAFCSDVYEKVDNNIDKLILLYKQRLKFIRWVMGERGGFNYIADEELYDNINVDNEDFWYRLVKEYNEISKNNPELIIDAQLADRVRDAREAFKKSTMAGVGFCKNLIEQYEGTVKDIYTSPYYLTTLAFEDCDITKPINYVFFNESEYYESPYDLSHNFCHEVAGHVCGHGNYKLNKTFRNKGKGYTYIGLSGILNKTIDNTIVDVGHYNNFEGSMLVEEYIVERIGMEVHDLFREMYGRDVFEHDSDMIEGQIDGAEVMYRYYGFMLERFWQTYRDKIIESRMSEDGGIYYDNNGVPPSNIIEKAYSSAEYNLMKIFNPQGLSERGNFNYSLLEQLGKLVEKYLHSEEYEYIFENDINLHDLTTKGIDFALEGHSQDIINGLKNYQNEANIIIDNMISLDNDINQRRNTQQKVKNQFSSYKSKIRSLINRKSESENQAHSCEEEESCQEMCDDE